MKTGLIMEEHQMTQRRLDYFRLTTWLALGGVCTLACSGARAPTTDEAASHFRFVVQARDEAGQVLADVQLRNGDTVVGHTDANGRAEFKLTGSEGQLVDLAVGCPPGYSAPAKPITLGLRHLSEHSPAPVFETLCVAELHSVLVGVRAELGSNLPILYLKQRVAQTDAEGVAHFLLRVAPSQTITLTLDTAREPQLRPQNPTLTFVAPERDEIVLCEQLFSLPVQRPRVVQKRQGPIRI
jgi:hypothetical protein